MSFSQLVTTFGTKTFKKIDDTRKGVTIKLFSAVIRDTPVDEGTLRANWQLTEGAPAEGTLNAKAPNKGGLSPQEADAVSKTTGDTPIFLTNNLDYAARIEFEGWSHTKAPEGMVRRNVVRFGRLISVEVANRK